MNNLVERLRGQYPIGEGEPPEFGMRQFPTASIQVEAADEIERLRERERELVEALEKYRGQIDKNGNHSAADALAKRRSKADD